MIENIIEIILNFTKKFTDTQIFVTTHSYDLLKIVACVLNRASEFSDYVLMHRLEKVEATHAVYLKNVIATTYSSHEIIKNINSGIEMRG